MRSYLLLFSELSQQAKPIYFNKNPGDYEICVRAKYFPTQISPWVQVGRVAQKKAALV